MNNLIEKIDKIIGKKGSVKAPAYFIRGLLIDIVKYFGNSINSLKQEVKRINTTTTNINKIVKNSPKGVVYAGYSNGSIDIKDIYRTHFMLGDSVEYSSWVVIYSIKQIKQVRVNTVDGVRTATITKHESYNNLFIYSFNLYQIYTIPPIIHKARHSITVQYNDDVEETISLLNKPTFSDIDAGVGFRYSNSINYFRVYSGNYIEINIDVPKDTTYISDNGSSSNEYGTFIILLNNHNVIGDYTKETENDKITFKSIKP